MAAMDGVIPSPMSGPSVPPRMIGPPATYMSPELPGMGQLAANIPQFAQAPGIQLPAINTASPQSSTYVSSLPWKPGALPAPGADATNYIQPLPANDLASWLRNEFSSYSRHRTSSGLELELTESQRVYEGRYDPRHMASIREMGGSEVYARITTVKCRGASAMLRDVYLGAERPWTVVPTPVPDLPDDQHQNIDTVLNGEVSTVMQMTGQPPDPETVKHRRAMLVGAAQQAGIEQAENSAREAGKRIDDILVEGKFYEALADFLDDLPIFPFAVIKGPTIRMTLDIEWQDGVPTPIERPRMFWQRVSPFDFWWSPGVSRVEDGGCFERIKLSVSDLQAVLGLPGYDDAAIRAVIATYNMTGYNSMVVQSDSQRQLIEKRESITQNVSRLMDSFEYNGPVPGKLLQQWGFGKDIVESPDMDYHVTAWMVGTYVIKAQINPHPKKRPPYYVTSFEHVPGAVSGHGLPYILDDVQGVANAALRSLVNNMAISSGPQVVLFEDQLGPNTASDRIYPWRVWRVAMDQMGRNNKPVQFEQPTSNAQVLLTVYQAMQEIADEVSAIPRYLTGNQKVGGAGRTASGLAMLMNNTGKVLQSVASRIDANVMTPLLQDLFLVMMLTDAVQDILLQGDERIEVRGVTMAERQELDRMRQMEFLSLTSNPIDTQIIGLDRRGVLLREIARTLGLPADQIVPSDDELRSIQQMAQSAGRSPAGPGAAPPPATGNVAATGMNNGAPGGPTQGTPRSMQGGEHPPQLTGAPGLTPGNVGHIARPFDSQMRTRSGVSLGLGGGGRPGS